MNAKKDPPQHPRQTGSTDRVTVKVSNSGDLDIHIDYRLVKWWRVLVIVAIVVTVAIFLGGGTGAWKALLIKLLSSH